MVSDSWQPLIIWSLIICLLGFGASSTWTQASKNENGEKKLHRKFVQTRNLIFSIQLFGQIPMCLHKHTPMPISSFARSRFGILLYEIEDHFLSNNKTTHIVRLRMIKISFLAFIEWTPRLVNAQPLIQLCLSLSLSFVIDSSRYVQ